MKAGTPLPPPLPVASLLSDAERLLELLDQVASLSNVCAGARFVVMRKNLELALDSPGNLATAHNQLDFIEEVSVALWEEPAREAGCRPGPPSGDRKGGAEPLERSWAELDAICERLCREAERWHARTSGAAGRAADGDLPLPNLRTP